jgi:hypothetical protein
LETDDAWIGEISRAYSSIRFGRKDEIGAISVILYHHHLDATVGMQMMIVAA